MNDVAAELSNSRIIAAYRERTHGSAELAREANQLFPSGITHDARNVDPYGDLRCPRAGPAQVGRRWPRATSITSAATARCCWAIAIRP